jgi:glucose/arabinose dehydrogenase
MQRFACASLVPLLALLGCGDSTEGQSSAADSMPDVSGRMDASLTNLATPPDAADEIVGGDGDQEERRDSAEQEDSDTRGDDEPDVADASEADAHADRFFFEPIALEGEPLAITEMRFIPGTTDEFLLLDKAGTVRRYRLNGSSASLLGAYQVKGVYSEADCGLLSLAFDPHFADNHFVYLGYCVSLQYSTIARHTLTSGDGGSIDDGREIITVGDANAPAAWHNVGSIGFDSDGNLWAVFGDKALTGSSQDTKHNLGTLIRILPSLDDGGATPYTIPTTNPFFGDPTRSQAIYAYGLRSPWRATLDTKGRYWIGDVGESTFEEIDVVTAPNQNLGWPMWEGPCFDACGDTVPPVASWNRQLSDPRAMDDPLTEGDGRRVAWVGREYVDRGNDRYRSLLTGKMLYGDFCAGWVRAMSLGADGAIASDQRIGHLESVTSWDQADDGYLYAVTYGSCYAFPYQRGGMWRLRGD